MEFRHYGENTTLECRHDSNEAVDKKKRYAQILSIFNEGGAFSAKEIAVIMCQRGYIPTTERNFSAPRITELCQDGLLEPVGKDECQYTGKTVTFYRRVTNEC